jgi:signal transduction histidine kinase
MTIGGQLGEAAALRPPLTRRLRLAHWIAIDCAAAAGVAVLLAGSAERAALFFGIPHWAAVAAAACVALPVAVRRLWPRAALAVILAGTIAAGVAGFSTDPPAAAALVLYIVALRLPRPAPVRLLAITVATVAAVIVAQMCFVAATRHDPAWAETMVARLLASGLVLTATWMIGYAVRQQRAYTAGLREQAERQAAEQVTEARRSIAEERLRIARELHDVVAHSLSLIAVQAGVANYVIGTRPEEAARALSSIEQTSRSALGEMRTLLGVLRADDPPSGGGLVPAPGLADLGQLTERAAAAGLRVDLEVRGQRQQPPAGIDLAAYRVIQEALTNVVKHAEASRCRVLLAYGDHDLTVEITDRGPGTLPGRPAPGHATVGDAGPGHGIAGLRERVVMYGGQFTAGPLPGRGFRVTARLPLAIPAP